MKKRLGVLLLGIGVAGAASAGTLVDLAVEASVPAANDLIRASLFSEAGGSDPAELARRVNGDVAAALKTGRAYPAVSVRSGGQHTWPVHAQAGKLDGWRMRSEIVLESREPAAVSELIGKLQQQRLAVASMTLMPSPDTQQKAGDEAIRQAIRAFEQRAALVGGQLGKSWKIRQLTISQNGNQPLPLMRAARGMAIAAEAAPAPLEAGESQITASVSGQIELAD